MEVGNFLPRHIQNYEYVYEKIGMEQYGVKYKFGDRNNPQHVVCPIFSK
jgi:hypothetical protein